MSDISQLSIFDTVDEQRKEIIAETAPQGIDSFPPDVLLKYAVSVKNHKLAKVALRKGASPNTIFESTGRPMLVAAAMEDDIKMMNILIAHPDCNINIQDENGYTALIVGAENLYPDVVSTCLRNHAKVGIIDYDGFTALSTVVGGLDVMPKILYKRKESHKDHTAEEKAEDEKYVIETSKVRAIIAKALLTHGANPDEIINNEWRGVRETLLMVSSRHGCAPLAEVLIKFRASVREISSEGFTASDLAEQNGHPQIIGIIDGKDSPLFR